MPERLHVEDLAPGAPLGAALHEGGIGIERWRYSDEEVLISEGDSCRELFLLEEGTVRVERPDATGASTRFLAMVEAQPGRVKAFGEMAYFLEGTRTATVRSIGGSVVLKVAEAGIPSVFRRFPDLAQDLFAGLVDKLREATRQLREFQDQFALGQEEVFVGQPTVLYESGQVVERMYVVASGCVVLTDDQGGTTTIRPAEPPDGFVGAREFLGGHPARVQATAQGGAILLAIPHRSRAAAIRTFPQLVMRLLEQG